MTFKKGSTVLIIGSNSSYVITSESVPHLGEAYADHVEMRIISDNENQKEHRFLAHVSNISLSELQEAA